MLILQTFKLLKRSPKYGIQMPFSCDICLTDRISYLLSFYQLRVYLQISELNKLPGVFLCLSNCWDYTF